MNKLLITRYGDGILSALWDGRRVLEFRMEEENPPIQVGDIYLGRVKNLVKNIHAAFVEVQSGLLCFLPLSANRNLREGDAIPVQVTREAVKTKAPVVADRISLSGRYLVLVDDKKNIAISTKIRDAQRREDLKALLADYPARESVGFIVRTNAQTAEAEAIRAEAERLLARYRKLMETAAHRPYFTCLMRGEPAYLAAIRDAGAGSLEAVVTDEEDIYRDLLEKDNVDFLEPSQICFYQDSRLSLRNLYRLEHFLEMAVNRRVWLKSGGYLVIELTEALTVIDVNTGKYEGHKGKEETFLQINREAAEEIAFQMRLRNLSGIIVVDFIDMEEPDNRQQLWDTFEEALRRDPVKTVLVDITALNLAEVTRKKTRKTLYEQLGPEGRRRILEK